MRTLIALLALISIPVFAADDPWQYHGIHLGAKTTPAQIMQALGVKTYGTYTEDPVNIWDDKHKDDLKHGLRWAIERQEIDLGPMCTLVDDETFDCGDPNAALRHGPGSDNHGIVRAWVFVRRGVVHEIDLQFDSLAADDFFDIAFRKFGRTGWQHQGEMRVVIVDPETKEKIKVDRQIYVKSSGLYQVNMTDYDDFMIHYAPNYQGNLSMRLLDQDF